MVGVRVEHREDTAMIIGHFSDLHSDYRRIVGTPDVWVSTGDIFPNWSRGDVSVEVPYQMDWFQRNAGKLVARLGGKPVICVSGNHDYVSLAELLRARGVETYDVSEGPVEFGGQTFAGFREVPFIAGEWAGEEFDLGPMVERAFSQNPTILLTHAPPAGILDDLAHHGRCGVGAAPLAKALTYWPHRITHHLFGHVHENGGKMVEEMGIQFYNGSGTCRSIEVG